MPDYRAPNERKSPDVYVPVERPGCLISLLQIDSHTLGAIVGASATIFFAVNKEWGKASLAVAATLTAIGSRSR